MSYTREFSSFYNPIFALDNSLRDLTVNIFKYIVGMNYRRNWEHLELVV